MSKIRVLSVDDSALMRQIMTEIINSHDDMEMVATAPDPLVARDLIKKFNPDVLTLDVEMPRMDGLDFLEKLMRLRPMPVVMVSSLTGKGSEVTLRALELGAVQLTIGRLSGEQLTTFRHLADATAAFVSGRRFLDVAGYVAANHAFHQFLIEATRNAQLIALYAQLTVRDYIDRALTASVEIVGDIVQQQRDLVSAFEYGDLNAARDVLAQHAQHSRTTMSRALALKTAPAAIGLPVAPPALEPEAPRCPFQKGLRRSKWWMTVRRATRMSTIAGCANTRRCCAVSRPPPMSGSCRATMMSGRPYATQNSSHQKWSARRR